MQTSRMGLWRWCDVTSVGDACRRLPVVRLGYGVLAGITMVTSGATVFAQGTTRSATTAAINPALVALRYTLLVGHNVFPVDTGPLRSGWQDLSRYNLGMCASAATEIQRNINQGFRQSDTLPYSIAMYDAVSAQAAHVARRCAGQTLAAGVKAFPADVVDTVFVPLVQLALMVQPDDSVLALITARQQRFATVDSSVNFLYQQLHDVLSARPVRMALVDTLVTRIDAFGESPGMLVLRWNAHLFVVREHWMRLGDFAASRPAIETALQRYRQIPARSRTQEQLKWASQLWEFLLQQALAEEGLNGPSFTATRRQMQDFFQGQFDDSEMIAPWQWIGKPLDLPPVAFWFPNQASANITSDKADVADHRIPDTSGTLRGSQRQAAGFQGYTPGRVTLFIRHDGRDPRSNAEGAGNMDHDWAEVSIVRRLAAKFKGQELDIVWLDKTWGFSYRSLTQTPTREAESRRHIWLEWLKLPVTIIGIEETPMYFAPPPNSRRQVGKTAFEQRYIWRWKMWDVALRTVLVDEHGTIRFVTPGSLKDDEAVIEASITRLLRRS